MNAFQLKMLAVGAMVVDHIGMFFFPEVILFRLIGRLAFPIFAWFIANGARQTKNVRAYALRLLGFAVISELPYHYANAIRDPSFNQLNIFFTLLLGLVTIVIIQRSPKLFWPIPIVLVAIVADVAHTDYGSLGVLSIVCFYLFFSNMRVMTAGLTAVFLLPYGLSLLFNPEGVTDLFSGDILENNMQLFGLLALIPIALYNGEQGRKMGYFFYLFYPLHLTVIFGIELVLRSQ